MLFDSQRVAPRALQDCGYQFPYPGLENALRAELGLADS
ncbi:MAG: DUF1731 domain-containing protein [Armatimonadetes bacterium]|nr:DUF1731 domain-containing protein [Armatimonadota bacterium]